MGIEYKVLSKDKLENKGAKFIHFGNTPDYIAVLNDVYFINRGKYYETLNHGPEKNKNDK